MKLVTGAQMGKIDKYSIEQLGIPGIVLMENAALKIVKHIKDYFEAKPHLPKEVVIIAGKGNNAGDAFAIARHLIISGYKTTIYCLFDYSLISGDAKKNFDILTGLKATIKFIDEKDSLKEITKDIVNSQMIIDGIFGTGFKGQIEGQIAKVVKTIGEYSKYTLSIDIASGVDSATGKVADICVKANKTVTFEIPKTGQMIYPGAEFTGKLSVEHIGIPRQAIDSIDINTFLTDSCIVKNSIPKRNAQFNKGNCGKVAIITGSTGMAGSGCLAAKASLRSGSGLVYVVAPKSLTGIYQKVVPEAVVVGLEEDNGVVSPHSTQTILERIKKCNVAAIGPGLSADKCIYYIVSNIAEQIDVPVVLDADALNALTGHTEVFGKFKKDVVITPHPGEMSRLTGLTIDYIQANRLEVAQKYSLLWGVILVLKGANTIVASSKGSVFINPTGNSGMATAGSGDALAGMIASLIGQGAEAFEAAVAGVYLHGLSGDLAAQQKGEHGMTAMDLIENIPEAFLSILR